jgi:hypothetical protein
MPFLPSWLDPRGLALAVGLTFAAGCATLPVSVTRKDFSSLKPGVARLEVLDEFGPPLSTTTNKAGNTVDIFRFVQGSRPSNKAPRPIEPEEADAQMLKVLLEKTGASPEAMLDGQTLTLQVNYDPTGRVEDTFLLSMKK